MNIAIIKTAIGYLQLEEENNEITKVFHVGSSGIILPPNTDTLRIAEKEFIDYFDGKLKKFTFKMNPKGSAFQKKVWENLYDLGYGETISYKDLAFKSGYPNAARAVGTAMRMNPIVVAIPCHRVIPSSGKFGNYSAGGPANKDWLLTFEKQNI